MCKKIRLFSQFRRHLAYHPPKPHLNPFIFRIRVPPCLMRQTIPVYTHLKLRTRKPLMQSINGRREIVYSPLIKNQKYTKQSF